MFLGQNPAAFAIAGQSSRSCFRQCPHLAGSRCFGQMGFLPPLTTGRLTKTAKMTSLHSTHKTKACSLPPSPDTRKITKGRLFLRQTLVYQELLFFCNLRNRHAAIPADPGESSPGESELINTLFLQNWGFSLISNFRKWIVFL